MKLLFTFDNAGSDALQELLGFSDADFKVNNLKADIINATDEIIELIGQPLYETITGIFEAESATDNDKELLYRTQLPIALNAYRNFAPDNDIAHTNNGRVQRIEDNQKTPWEWQIDRSNKSMERKYYKSLDALINFMDANISGWKATDAYKATHALFVRTTKDFDTYFEIGRSRLLLIKLAPGLRQAENQDILPRIGKDTFENMKATLQGGNTVDNTALLEKIKEACVYSALAWGLPRLSVQLFPEGVLQAIVSDRLTTQAKQVPANNEAITATQLFKEDASRALAEIESMISAANAVPDPDAKPYSPYYDCDDKFMTL